MTAPPTALPLLPTTVVGAHGRPSWWYLAAEAIRTIEFAPDYPAAPDTSQKVRAMMAASPQMRDFINDYMRNPPKR